MGASRLRGLLLRRPHADGNGGGFSHDRERANDGERDGTARPH